MIGNYYRPPLRKAPADRGMWMGGDHQRDLADAVKGERLVTQNGVLVGVDGAAIDLDGGGWDVPFFEQSGAARGTNRALECGRETID